MNPCVLLYIYAYTPCFSLFPNYSTHAGTGAPSPTFEEQRTFLGNLHIFECAFALKPASRSCSALPALLFQHRQPQGPCRYHGLRSNLVCRRIRIGAIQDHTPASSGQYKVRFLRLRIDQQ